MHGLEASAAETLLWFLDACYMHSELLLSAFLDAEQGKYFCFTGAGHMELKKIILHLSAHFQETLHVMLGYQN